MKQVRNFGTSLANPQEFVFNYAVCGTMLTVMLALIIPLIVCKISGCTRTTDQLDLVLSVVFSVPLVTTWRSIVSLIQRSHGAAMTSRSLLAEVADQGFCNSIYGNAPECNAQAVELHLLSTWGLIISISLSMIQLGLAIRYALILGAFQRGMRSNEWYLLNKRWAMPPRRLATRSAYLRGHYAPHASRWEIVVWLRHALLLAGVISLRFTMAAAAGGSAAKRAAARYGTLAPMVILYVLLGCCQQRVQPFALDLQNRLYVWLFVSNTMLLVLGGIFSSVMELNSTSSTNVLDESIETLLIILVCTDVFVSIGCSALIVYYERRRTSRALAQMDLSDVLIAAAASIDAPLRDRLADGTIRLLRVDWLLSPTADMALGRDTTTGAPILRRRQELPSSAFFGFAQAAAMLGDSKRSILVLSHGWQTAKHPDPCGATLLAIRRFLASDRCHSGCGLFIECAQGPVINPHVFACELTLTYSSLERLLQLLRPSAKGRLREPHKRGGKYHETWSRYHGFFICVSHRHRRPPAALHPIPPAYAECRRVECQTV